MALSDNELLKLSQLKRSDLQVAYWGASVHRRAGAPLSDVVSKVTADRWRFAESIHNEAIALSQLQPATPRLVINRSYYCMYHAARAVVYFTAKGDDYEKHSKLPTKLPDTFPNHTQWSNELKTARLDRNKADYEPYPTTHAHWPQLAAYWLPKASAFLVASKHYLRSRGIYSI